MITLKQLVKEQELSGINDVQIIKAFFTLNDMEEEGIDLIHEITKTKIEKMKHRERIVKEWTSHLPSKYLYQHYDLDTASTLHNLELDYLANGCELSDSYLKWAKENVPDIVMPEVYFRPLIEWLDNKGVRFKGEAPIENKIYMNYV